MCGLNSDVIFVGFEVLMTCVVTLGGVLGIGSSVHVGNCVEVRLHMMSHMLEMKRISL